MAELKLTVLENEYWYGLSVQDGSEMPIHKGSNCTIDIDPNKSVNQAAPLLVSSEGRYIWCEDGFILSVQNGQIRIIYYKKEPVVSDGHDSFLELHNLILGLNCYITRHRTAFWLMRRT